MTREQMIDEAVRRFPNVIFRNRASVEKGCGIWIYSEETNGIIQEFHRIEAEQKHAA